MNITVGRTPDKVEVVVDTESHLVSVWGEFDPDHRERPLLRTHRPKELGDLLVEAANIRADHLQHCPRAGRQGEAVSGEEYTLTLDVCAAAYRTLACLRIADAQQVCDQADVLGPLLEPTAYVGGGRDNVRDASAVLRAAADFVAAVERIRPAAVA